MFILSVFVSWAFFCVGLYNIELLDWCVLLFVVIVPGWRGFGWFGCFSRFGDFLVSGFWL